MHCLAGEKRGRTGENNPEQTSSHRCAFITIGRLKHEIQSLGSVVPNLQRHLAAIRLDSSKTSDVDGRVVGSIARPWVPCGEREECSDYVERFELRNGHTIPVQHGPLNSVPASPERSRRSYLRRRRLDYFRKFVPTRMKTPHIRDTSISMGQVSTTWLSAAEGRVTTFNGNTEWLSHGTRFAPQNLNEFLNLMESDLIFESRNRTHSTSAELEFFYPAFIASFRSYNIIEQDSRWRPNKLIQVGCGIPTSQRVVLTQQGCSSTSEGG